MNTGGSGAAAPLPTNGLRYFVTACEDENLNVCAAGVW